MIRKMFVLLSLGLFVGMAYAEVREYKNSYMGIEPGQTPIHMVLEIMGKPRDIKEHKDNIHYLYSQVKVSALKSTGRVNTVSILDKKYTDPNGLRLGDTRSTLEREFGSISNKSYFGDMEKGIIYWFRDGRVYKIVLAHKLVIR